MPQLPALDPQSIQQVVGARYPAEFSASTAGRLKRALTGALGLTQFGVNITELPPGGATALRHWHSHEDEFVYVLQGDATLVSNAGTQALAAGMCAGFPAGVEDGHCIVNTSGATATILEVGTRDDRDTGHYPDDDLYIGPGRYKGEAKFTRKDGTPY